VFGGNGQAPVELDYSGGTVEGQPSALQQVAAGGGIAAGESGAEAAEEAVGGGVPEPIETVVKDEHDKIGRNDPCWCGSGKKYKKCHGA
jgi:preprotein translocase subunit SecA